MAEDSFKCEPGHVLTRQEADQYVAYRNAGVAAPDGYDDVVQENALTGFVYRCKTKEEKEAAERANKAEVERGERLAKMENDIREAERERQAKIMGVDPASLPIELAPTGSRSMVNDAGPTDTGNAGGEVTDTKRRS